MSTPKSGKFSTLGAAGPLRAEAAGAPVAVQLVLVGPEHYSVHDVPADGALLLGRGDEVDVRLPDEFASREHAALHAEGGRFYLEDLGSANGTTVRQAIVPPHCRIEVSLGETVAIGSTLLVLQPVRTGRAAAQAQTPRGFAGAVEEACGRVREEGGAFAIIGVRVIDGIIGGPVVEELTGALGPADLLGAEGPAAHTLLLQGMGRAEAEQRAAALAGALRAAGILVATSVAACPEGGLDPSALLDQVRAPLRGAGAGRALVVQDGRMRRLYELARGAAAGVVGVLIVGERGAGKNTIANLVHRLSPRADKPFLCIDCATLADGALVGAERAPQGPSRMALVESAPGGTVLLDDVAALPPALQAELLCLLETREVTRAGGLKGEGARPPADVRIVATVRRSLEREVAEGRFRKDLYLRLAGVVLHVPPLRERPGEIALLAQALLAEACERLGRPAPPTLTPEALAALEAHGWPGNVAELADVMTRVAATAPRDEIVPADLPLPKPLLGTERVVSFVPQAVHGNRPTLPLAALIDAAITGPDRER